MLNKDKSRLDLIWRLVLFIWAAGIIFPLLWTFYISLKSNLEFFQNPWSLPQKLQWINYVKAFTSIGIGSSMLNTAYYVGGSMVIGIALATVSAYVLTRLQWKGKKFIWEAVMLSLFLPGINILVPQYIMMTRLHLNDSLNGLIFLNSIGMSAFDLMILGGFMSSLPKELEESAYIDGAGIFQTFRSIIVPLSMPGIVTISIFKFLGLYNDFLNPFIYLSDPKKYTIAVNMYHANQLMQYKSDWVTLFAAVILAMIPSLIVYIIFQKQIIEGATLGAVKG